MQIFTYQSSLTYIPDKDHDSYILFDIETTGLSPETSTIFMIGCGYYENQHFHSVQWLAESYEFEEEQFILKSFSEWLNDRKSSYAISHFITYNGSQFDLPFLKSRYEQCKMDYPLGESIVQNHFDYYRIISKHKHLWPIKNTKLNTVASWLGYKSSNTPSGRQLIKTYHSYIKTKDPALLNLLFLHNINDLEALSTVISIDTLFNFFKAQWNIDIIAQSNESLILKISSDKVRTLPFELNLEKYGFSLDLTDNYALIHIPVYPNGLRYYYNDIKNYIYLPAEGHALHKSMSTYIDRSHWIKATEENCFTYFSPDDTFFNNIKKQTGYIRMIFQLFGFF